MTRSRILCTALLALVAALGLAAPAPAGAATSQAVAFTTTPPSGDDWFYGDFGGPTDVGYVARAEATSGLPVTYSIDPASTGVCRISAVFEDDPYFGTGAGIEYLGAGTCTVRADQAGDGTYAPAPRASQSFVIDRVATTIVDARAKRGTAGRTPTTFSATLLRPYRASHSMFGVQGYPGQVLTFSVGGRSVCSATTGTDGVATCGAVLRLADLLRLRFTVSYGGSTDYSAASTTAWFRG